MRKFNGSDTAKKRSILKKDSLYKEETEKLISDNYHKGGTESGSESATGSAFVPISKDSFKPHKPVVKAKSHAQPIKFVGLDDDTDSQASGRGSPALSISHCPDVPWKPPPPFSPTHAKSLHFPDGTPDLMDTTGSVDGSSTGSPAHHHRIHRVPSYCANTSTYGPPRERSTPPVTAVAPSASPRVSMIFKPFGLEKNIFFSLATCLIGKRQTRTIFVLYGFKNLRFYN